MLETYTERLDNTIKIAILLSHSDASNICLIMESIGIAVLMLPARCFLYYKLIIYHITMVMSVSSYKKFISRFSAESREIIYYSRCLIFLYQEFYLLFHRCIFRSHKVLHQISVVLRISFNIMLKVTTRKHVLIS